MPMTLGNLWESLMESLIICFSTSLGQLTTSLSRLKRATIILFVNFDIVPVEIWNASAVFALDAPFP